MNVGRPEGGRHRACVWQSPMYLCGQPNCQKKIGVVKTIGLTGGGTTQAILCPVVQFSCPSQLCPSSPISYTASQVFLCTQFQKHITPTQEVLPAS